jgi:hypothetical protein
VDGGFAGAGLRSKVVLNWGSVVEVNVLFGFNLLRGCGLDFDGGHVLASSGWEDDAVVQALAHVEASSVGGDDAEAQLQSIGQRSDTLGTTRVLADNDALSPVVDGGADPAGEEGLGDQVVDRALEEALHLAGVEVDGDDMVNASNVHQVGNHAGGDGSTVTLLLGLARVGEVGHDGRDGLGRASLASSDHDEQLHDIVVGPEEVSRVLQLPHESTYLWEPLCTMKTSWSRTDVLISTLVSPLANFLSSTLSGFLPSFSQMASVRTGWLRPPKTQVRRMIDCRRSRFLLLVLFGVRGPSDAGVRRSRRGRGFRIDRVEASFASLLLYSHAEVVSSVLFCSTKKLFACFRYRR